MNWSLEQLLLEVPHREGNGGKLLSADTTGGASDARSTVIENTTAAAKLIMNGEADARAEKTARLKADREARDRRRSK